MANSDITPNDSGKIVGQVDDRAVLDISPFAYFDVIDVTAQDGGVPYARVCAQTHVAHDRGLRRDVGGGVDARGLAEKFLEPLRKGWIRRAHGFWSKYPQRRNAGCISRENRDR